jgi:hypothetical protein
MGTTSGIKQQVILISILHSQTFIMINHRHNMEVQGGANPTPIFFNLRTVFLGGAIELKRGT